MKISELAERSGTTPQTIRYYESLGLIRPVERQEGRHRRYNEEALKRLEKIAVLQDAGLSLEEIAKVIDLYFVDATGIKGKLKVIEILEEHLAAIDKRIAEFQQYRIDLVKNIKRLKGLIAKIESKKISD